MFVWCLWICFRSIGHVLSMECEPIRPKQERALVPGRKKNFFFMRLRHYSFSRDPIFRYLNAVSPTFSACTRISGVGFRRIRIPGAESHQSLRSSFVPGGNRVCEHGWLRSLSGAVHFSHAEFYDPEQYFTVYIFLIYTNYTLSDPVGWGEGRQKGNRDSVGNWSFFIFFEGP